MLFDVARQSQSARRLNTRFAVRARSPPTPLRVVWLIPVAMLAGTTDRSQPSAAAPFPSCAASHFAHPASRSFTTSGCADSRPHHFSSSVLAFSVSATRLPGGWSRSSINAASHWAYSASAISTVPFQPAAQSSCNGAAQGTQGSGIAPVATGNGLKCGHKACDGLLLCRTVVAVDLPLQLSVPALERLLGTDQLEQGL